MRPPCKIHTAFRIPCALHIRVIKKTAAANKPCAPDAVVLTSRHRGPCSRPVKRLSVQALRTLDASRRLRMDGQASRLSPRADSMPDPSAGAPASAPATPLCEIRGLHKRYGDQAALADVSFTADAGEIVGLIGPNGAGKTTLLEAIAGLLAVDAGEVLWRGEPLPAARRRDFIFYLPDGIRPYADQSAAQVVAFFADVYGKPRHAVAEAVAAVGLDPVLHKRVRALSKGFARRLILAIGLLTPHPLLLMDEPFDGLDLRQTREISEVLRCQAANSRTLVLAIHQLTDAERICDRFVLLADGRVHGSGTLATLRRQTGIANGNLEAMFLALT